MYDDMESLNKELTVKLEESKVDDAQTISELHKCLRETEGDLSTVISDKASLTDILDQVERDNQSLSTELNESVIRSKAWTEKESKLKKRAKEGDRTLVMISLQKDKLAESEKNLSTQLNEMKVHLDETERLLSSVKAEKDNLQSTVDDLQCLIHDLSLEVNDSKSNMVLDSTERNGEKEKLQSRLRDSLHTMVKLTKQKDDLAMQKSELANQNTALEKKLREVPPPPPDQSAEFTRLQQSFFKEKEEMMDRQQRLEHMLRDALNAKVEDDKENSKKKAVRKITKRLTLDSMKTRAPSVPKQRSPPRPHYRSSSRPTSRPRQSLSPSSLPPPIPRQPLSPSSMSQGSRRRVAIDPE